MARCVIVSAGSISPREKRFFRADDTIIACDAGYQSCEALGVAPHILVGDFDSAPLPNVPGAVVLPHIKDDTDTHYAARLAVERGFSEVLMLGALGGRRLEHTLANLATGLWLCHQGVSAAAADDRTWITYVLPGRPARFPRGAYKYLSLFPAEGQAQGVTLAGAFYPLQDATLTADFPLGVSNEWAAEAITVAVRQGALLVVQTLDDG